MREKIYDYIAFFNVVIIIVAVMLSIAYTARVHAEIKEFENKQWIRIEEELNDGI